MAYRHRTVNNQTLNLLYTKYSYIRRAVGLQERGTSVVHTVFGFFVTREIVEQQGGGPGGLRSLDGRHQVRQLV